MKLRKLWEMEFKNLTNGHIENKTVPALWCVLFGPLYFLLSGIWIHALVMFVITFFLISSMGIHAILLVIFLHIIYGLFASSIVESYYLRRGWKEVNYSSEIFGNKVGASQNSEDKSCPFCAEKIKYAAIKCKHCGADIEPPNASLDKLSVSGKVLDQVWRK